MICRDYPQATAAATTYDYSSANPGAYTGGVADLQVLNPGAGYDSSKPPTVTINGNGSGASATAIINGITGIVVDAGGTGYDPKNPPSVTITDTKGSGTGATANATVDPLTGAITGITLSNPGKNYFGTTTLNVTIGSKTTGAGASATAYFNPTQGAITGFYGAPISNLINGLSLTNPGAGYTNPKVVISVPDLPGGKQATATATASLTGELTITLTDPGTGYLYTPTVTITDPVDNTVTPPIGGTFTTQATATVDFVIAGYTSTIPGLGYTTPIAGMGLKKFVDLLPGIPGVSSYTTALGYTNGVNNLGQALPLAVADTSTFSGSDYYVIAEVAYTKQLHSNLPPTHLRGYVQVQPDGSSTGFTIAGFKAATDQMAYASQYANYLGPIILAQKERAVRVKLVNLLPTGAAGNLPFPVDHTYMGASETAVSTNNTDNRTAMHLHGGNTPWISDGTPRQWIKPAGELGNKRGVSATDVPDMWFDASGNLIVDPLICVQGTTTCTTAGATNYPGDGALTFYYTNDQSARLMFYHDHAEGITRLNVYDGMAAGYLLQDLTEQDLVHGTNVSGNNTALNKVLPPIEDTIPLVIQEKTFVPDATHTPVLNFYGPFASQLNSQDPTWRWGWSWQYDTTKANPPMLSVNGTLSQSLNGTGDLWVPHVFMPNQNPGDVSGANNFGRWDYGPWFWPPFTGITHGAVTNPYYDPNCVSSVTNYCEGLYIPGVPNGNTLTSFTGLDPKLATLGEPSGTPEAFNDTPLVNGTVYPVLKVDPKQYRLRILSVGNDRMLNLSLVVAASNTSPVTADQNAAPAKNTTVLCDGGVNSPTDRSVCTEARMVPFNATQDAVSSFPTWWYTKQKGGVTFDGRPSGVFDPATRGPAMVQIGTDGGFLSTPVVINNQPVNFEYNLKNIVVTNVKEHALLLGPAERADVLVDFSNFAGATLLLYNDSPAPMPAFDLRLDYFTGDYDNTDTGGAFSTVPGYGPNTRTIMQIQVASTCGTGIACTSTHKVDDTGNINIAKLTTAVQTAFRTSQEPIIVPQAAYNATYNANVADSTLSTNANHNLALIQDYSLRFTPFTDPANSGAVTGSVLMDMQSKTIIEDWTTDYGRMNAVLGVEIPKTTATTNTALPLDYTDPPTELVKITPDTSAVGVNPLTDGTALWRITHNGVDSHAIHFHLFHVQIINRVGWDGMIRQTEPNELGWKDTVRMNPLEDVVVALRPKHMADLPFKVPNSHRLMDTTLAQGAPAQVAAVAPAINGVQNFFNLDPQSGNASTVTNQNLNYGWEYVWHCHILGHEENDMMRSIAVAQTPDTPTMQAPIIVSQAAGAAIVTVNWTDNSIISNWVTIQRALDSGFTTGLKEFNVKEDECTVQSGCPRSYVDNNVPAATSVYYRVIAKNTVGGGDFSNMLPTTLATSLTPGFTGYDNVTVGSSFSGSASRIVTPTASVTTTPTSPAASLGLIFGDQVLNTISATQTVTLTNVGTGNLSSSGAVLTTGTHFGIKNNCPTILAPDASCTVDVAFKPTSVPLVGSPPLQDMLTISDNSVNGGVANPTQTVAILAHI